MAKSNVGMPQLVDGRAVYLADPAVMATCALEMRAAGATVVGACCGSTPAHLQAMAEALCRRSLTADARASLSTRVRPQARR